MFRKELLKPGDDILVHTKGFSPVSMSTRVLTESYWNHAGKYVVEAGKGYVIEALFKGVVKTPLETYLNTRKYDLKAVRLCQEAFRDAQEYEEGVLTGIDRMYDKIGQKYDKWAIVWLGIKLIGKGCWKKGTQYVPIIGNPFQGREEVFCSEAICESDHGISSLHPYLYQGKTGQKCDTTTPKDIGKSQWVVFVTGEDKL